MTHRSYDWSGDWRGYGSIEERDADIQAEKEASFQRKVRKAIKANFDTKCAVAAELYGHGTPQHAAEIAKARRDYEDAELEYLLGVVAEEMETTQFVEAAE